MKSPGGGRARKAGERRPTPWLTVVLELKLAGCAIARSERHDFVSKRSYRTSSSSKAQSTASRGAIRRSDLGCTFRSRLSDTLLDPSHPGHLRVPVPQEAYLSLFDYHQRSRHRRFETNDAVVMRSGYLTRFHSRYAEAVHKSTRMIALLTYRAGLHLGYRYGLPASLSEACDTIAATSTFDGLLH